MLHCKTHPEDGFFQLVFYKRHLKGLPHCRICSQNVAHLAKILIPHRPCPSVLHVYDVVRQTPPSPAGRGRLQLRACACERERANIASSAAKGIFFSFIEAVSKCRGGVTVIPVSTHQNGGICIKSVFREQRTLFWEEQINAVMQLCMLFQK